jgi:hypothetical protein
LPCPELETLLVVTREPRRQEQKDFALFKFEWFESLANKPRSER